MSNGISVRNFITCPHCWSEFPVDQFLWVSESPDNLGDIRLGESAQQRFLPTRFNERGSAVDSAGFVCNRLACPRCHLVIPRQFVEFPPYFVSIVGAPASGKSYFLASMCWKLRRTLPAEFGIAFSDADPEMNLRLHHYESTQFMSESSQLVAIEKTEVYGSLYNTVLFNEQRISYPQPFIFSLTPMSDHPNSAQAQQFSHLLSLYDNAGESYLPGADAGTHPVTRHLASSNCIFFLYDPTQDHKFRAACLGKKHKKTADPQLLESVDGNPIHRSPMRQETVLAEMVKRVRQHTGLASSEKHQKPLYIIVTKLDAWSHLLGCSDWSNPWKKVRSRDPANLVVKNKSASKDNRSNSNGNSSSNSGNGNSSGNSAKNSSVAGDVFEDFNWNPFENDDTDANSPNYSLLQTFGSGSRESALPKNGQPNASDNDSDRDSATQSATPVYRSVLSGFATKRVEDASDEVRKLLQQFAPEIVTTAEQFASVVKYIPMSATGRAPTLDPQSGMFGFRPRDIAPIWAEVPVLYALAKSTRGMVPVLQPKKT